MNYVFLTMLPYTIQFILNMTQPSNHSVLFFFTFPSCRFFSIQASRIKLIGTMISLCSSWRSLWLWVIKWPPSLCQREARTWRTTGPGSSQAGVGGSPSALLHHSNTWHSFWQTTLCVRGSLAVVSSHQLWTTTCSAPEPPGTRKTSVLVMQEELWLSKMRPGIYLLQGSFPMTSPAKGIIMQSIWRFLNICPGSTKSWEETQSAPLLCARTQCLRCTHGWCRVSGLVLFISDVVSQVCHVFNWTKINILE